MQQTLELFFPIPSLSTTSSAHCTRGVDAGDAPRSRSVAEGCDDEVEVIVWLPDVGVAAAKRV